MKIEKACIIDRYNLVDETKETEDRYIRQMSKEELINLTHSIMELIK